MHARSLIELTLFPKEFTFHMIRVNINDFLIALGSLSKLIDSIQCLSFVVERSYEIVPVWMGVEKLVIYFDGFFIEFIVL